MSFPQPLAGLSVLDFSMLLPGPFCTSMLAQYGAEVIKVERPEGDPVRKRSVFLFDQLNAGKKSIVLDMKSPGFADTVLELAKDADAVVEGFRPGVMDRAGVGYDQLKSVNPALVYCSISGFGQDGPYRDRAAHDLNFLAVGGYFSVPSQLDGRISRPNVRLADTLASVNAAYATSMAMLEAQKTGKGCHIDANIFDGIANWSLMLLLAGGGMMPEKTAQFGHVMADSEMYETSDGRFITIGTLEDKFWVNLVEAISPQGHPLRSEVFQTRRGRDKDKHALQSLLAEQFKQNSLKQWEEILRDVDTAWGTVYQGLELLRDPHLVERELVQERNGFKYPAFPVSFSQDRGSVLSPAPKLGENTGELLDGLQVASQETSKL